MKDININFTETLKDEVVFVKHRLIWSLRKAISASFKPHLKKCIWWSNDYDFVWGQLGFLFIIVDRLGKEQQITQNNDLQKTNQGESVELKGRVFEISSYQWKDGDIDPFDPNNLTFYPYVTQIVGQLQNKTEIPIQFEQVTLENGHVKNTFFIESKTIIGSPPNGLPYNDFIDYQIAVGYCNQSLIPSQFKCADNERNEEYIEQVNYFTMVFYITGYDTKKKELYQIPKYYQLRIAEDDADLIQFHLKLSDTQTDDGILFNNYNKYSFVSDFIVSTHKIDFEQTPAQYGQITPIIVYLTLDQIKEEVLVEYEKISEILANTGSIISWILQISFIVLKYNEKICSEKTIKEVIKLYFPDIEKITIDRNMLGKFIGVRIKDKKYDPEKISQLFSQLSDIAVQKVNFINLQYEVSRIQFAITNTLGIDCLKNSFNEKKLETFIDNLGYRIEQPNDNNSINMHPQQQIRNQLFLQDNIMVQDGNNTCNNLEQDMIESTIGLFQMENSNIIPKVESNKVEKLIFPKEDLKVEEVSRLGSIR